MVGWGQSKPRPVGVLLALALLFPFALQPAHAQTACGKPIDIYFSLDNSGSMGWNDPLLLRAQASKDFVAKLNASLDRAGVVHWDTTVIQHLGLTGNLALVNQTLDQAGAFGGTNLNVGLNTPIDGLQASGRQNASRVIIFLTDGDGTYTPSGQPGSPADRAAGLGIRIYTIGLNAPSQVVWKPEETPQVTGGVYSPSPSVTWA